MHNRTANLGIFVVMILALSFSSAFALVTRTAKHYYYKDDALPQVILDLYVPDTNMVYRGAIMEANSGQEQTFCNVFGWVMIAVSLNNTPEGIPGAVMYSKYAVGVMRGLDAWAALDNRKHPEFSYMPIITEGCSNGGSLAYGLAMYAWQRTICFGCNVGGGYNPAVPTDSMSRVPGMFTVGEVDHNVGQYNPLLDTLIKKVRPRGALWSHAYIWGMGHEKRRVHHMFSMMFEKLIRFSYPDSVDPRKGPVNLRRPREQDGWLADPSTWKSGFTVIAPYAQYAGDKGKAEWLFDQDMAWVYRGYSSTGVSLALHTKDTAVNNDFTSWWQYNLYKPGDKVVLLVDTNVFSGWTKIELYRGCTLVDSIKRGQALGDTMKFTVAAPASPMMQGYNLMGYDNTSRTYPSILYTVMVAGSPVTRVWPDAPGAGNAGERSAAYRMAFSPAIFDIAGRKTSPAATAKNTISIRNRNGVWRAGFSASR